ncbi:SusC/RagA family TonB-linked outer membrane protein [Echinicola vietnamensis]|uniref:TonB-linked outer membrane protein, SusC/RagA family n=1 Tax=Echinicola vietnamensis (strain DSM 17526 / LMG 23754 / KMM 6221) TaxID=926556 RepID=L0FWX7_ECHVK|nr:TonB-dependent receptor [Echinicola vietnamensis]AGA78414.1 TonB-linked outer membrane protein, SusC/RagA family [Echinicola vietnamensis DSM 17526]
MKIHLLSKMKFVGILVLTLLIGLGDISAHQYALANSSWKRNQRLEDVNVSLKMKNANMIQVLKKIESVTGFHVAFMEGDLSTAQNITLDVKQQSLLHLLETLSRDYNVHFTQVNNTIHARPKEEMIPVGSLEERSISGKVLDEEGIPIPGVNVIVKGTKKVTVTDLDGVFAFDNIAEDAVLVFTFIGFESQEISVTNKETISVTLLEDIGDLEEVVVVGYGTQKKANLTGAVSTVEAKALENRPVTNVANALQGTTPGLNITRTGGQPGNENVGIQVRGVTSANGAVDPLLMVDGVPSPLFTLQTINPNDIESVTVLKDAAAAAIYGAQAAGGVILVKTKAGKTGKTTFEYSNQFGTEWALNVPERLSLLDEALYSNLARANAGLGPEYNEQALQYIRDGVEFVPSETNENRWVTYNQQSIREQVLRKTSPMQTHNLSARGGTESVNYLVSLGYYDKKGVFKIGPDSFERYNARFNLGAKLTKHLSLDSRISYANHFTKAPSIGASGYGLLQQVYQARQRFPIFMPDGRLFGGAGTSGNNTYGYLSQGGYNNTQRNDFDGVFTGTLKDVVKGLTIRSIFGRQYRRADRERFARTVELWDRGGDSPAYILNNPNAYELTQDNTINTSFQMLVDYDLTIAEKHAFHVLAGYQWEDYRWTRLYSRANNLINNDLPTLNLGDDNTKVTNQSINTYANQSVFGRINYSFDDRFLFEGTIRMDESSRLAPGLRTKVFPAASVGWNMHREDFFAEALPFFSEFKLRGSWGQLGSALGGDIIGYYDYLNVLSRGSGLVMGSDETRSTYFYQSSVPSSELSWETIETWNGGVDLGLLENKLQMSFDYYVKHNRNMLTPLQLPGTFGVGTPKINNGVLKSWGWELAVNYRDRVNENFNYNIGFNISDNQNELIEYSGRNVVGAGNNNIIEGFPLNTIWGYETVPGYFSSADQVDGAPFQDNRTGPGDIQYVNQDGDDRITVGRGTTDDSGDLVLLGANQQRYLFGMTASAQWKNFDFSVFFQGVGKRSFMPTRDMIMPLSQSWFMPMKHHQDYWTPENPDAEFPRPFLNGHHNYLPSDRWVLDGSYIRLKNFQVGYSLPATLVSRVKVNRARVFITGQDVLTFTKMGVFNGVFDPENSNNVRADYPFFGTLAIGLNLSF